jgi:septal ring factor EnvC (AmiA/AmiB activator)
MGRRTALNRNFFLLGTLLAFMGVFPAQSFSQDSSGTPTKTKLNRIKKNIHKSKKDLAAIEKKLAEEKEKKRQDEIKEKKVLSGLQKLDKTLWNLRKEKDTNEQGLKETRQRIVQLKSEYSLNQEQLEQNKQLLKKRLLALYLTSFRRPFLGGLLAADSFSVLARKLRFEMNLAQGNEKLLDQTLQTKKLLKQEWSQWKENERNENRILSVLGHQETNYSIQRHGRKVYLSNLERQKETRERIIAELSQAAEDLQEKVASLLHQAEEAKQQKGRWESAGEGLLVKRGKIPWPVSGRIIRPFGRYKNPPFKEIVDNSGIQIQAPEGTPFRAVGDGTVRYADWFKGYGKLVILDHGEGYYSIYAQAADLDVSEGERVQEGQVLGTVGDTGSLVGTSLYFEIRKNGKPQNPATWLSHRQ